MHTYQTQPWARASRGHGSLAGPSLLTAPRPGTMTPPSPRRDPGAWHPCPWCQHQPRGWGQEDPRPTPTDGDERGWGPRGRGRALQTPKCTAAPTTPGAGAAWPCEEDPAGHGVPTRTRWPDALLETTRAEWPGPQSTPRELSLAGPVLFRPESWILHLVGGTCPPWLFLQTLQFLDLL